MDPICSGRLHAGSRGDYEWVVTDATLGDLLELCPECVLGRYVSVTSFDSGPLSLNDVENSAGWESRGRIAYSPKIQTTDGLPYDNCFDEWYVFDKPSDLGCLAEQGANVFRSELIHGRVYAFVNYGLGFSLHLPNCAGLTELFWKQIEWIQPLSYIADGEQLTFVTKDKATIQRLKEALDT